jgi:hypothetical protein
MAKAIWPVRLERSDRAAAFGTYPISSAALVTRSCVSALVRIPFSTRDADATETFASLATVVIVGTSWRVSSVSSTGPLAEKDY